MPNDLSGEALREAFFTTCLGWYPEYGNNDKSLTPYWVDADDNVYEWLPEVSTNATACEAWAMRWAREQGLVAMVEEMLDGRWCASLAQFDGDGELVDSHDSKGQDWKEAFVRACVAAGQVLNQARGGT